VLTVLTFSWIVNDSETDTTRKVTVKRWSLQVLLFYDLLCRELGTFAPDKLVTDCSAVEL